MRFLENDLWVKFKLDVRGEPSGGFLYLAHDVMNGDVLFLMDANFQFSKYLETGVSLSSDAVVQIFLETGIRLHLASVTIFGN